MNDYKPYLDFARETIELAGQLALKYFRQTLEVDNKFSDGRFDPVTQADRAVESLIREKLNQHFPEHGILGEEYGNNNKNHRLCWIIDPIDGTRSFMSGAPTWGILLGLCLDEQPWLGLMHQPFTGETFVGAPGFAKAYRGQEQHCLSTRSDVKLTDAVVYSTHPDCFETPSNWALFQAAAKQCRLMRYGGDCYSLCLLAYGQIDAVIEGEVEAYDIVPLIPIIEAAGGVVTDYHGQPFSQRSGIIASANLNLHQQILGLKGCAS